MRQVTFEPTSVTALELFEFGAGDGPDVLITAAVHGDEQTATHAARLLMKTLESQPVHGRVRVIPVCNPAAYRNRSRRSPFDELDMNRIFPGSPTGSPTMQLADRLWAEAQSADYIVDLHCAGWGATPYTLAVYEEFPVMRAIAEALGIPVVIQSGGTRGQLFVEACHAGKRALIIELPGGQPGGTIHLEAAAQAERSLVNLLRTLKVLDGAPTPSEVTFYGKIREVAAPGPGLFVPAVEPGSRVEEGAVLGSFEGAPVRAPHAGVVTSISLPRYCFAGEWLAGVAPTHA